MKRYLLFAGDTYYPSGGAYDFVSSHDTIEEAMAVHDPSKYTYSGGWANIFDTHIESIVMNYSYGSWSKTDKYYD